jgi:hypothetical protein
MAFFFKNLVIIFNATFLIFGTEITPTLHFINFVCEIIGKFSRNYEIQNFGPELCLLERSVFRSWLGFNCGRVITLHANAIVATVLGSMLDTSIL